MLIIVASCLGDPVGPGALVVDAHGASADTLWIGAPGENLPGNVQLTIRDESGRPIPAAQLVWEVSGKGAQLVSGAAETDAAGKATAVWQLGTDAAEEQHLHLVVMTPKHQRDFEIRARAVPYLVKAVRLSIDTPAVVRLGDTLSVAVRAIDPYGNEFPAPDLVVTTADTVRARAIGDRLLAGPRRGATLVRVASRNAEMYFPVQVVQYVASIQPVSDSLRFSALGAQRSVAYVVRDDRGRVVADTAVAISVADASIAQLEAGYVRALSLGVTTLRLSLGPATASIVVGVQQRVGSLQLVRDTIRLDALRDTTTVNPIVHDSLGSPIPNPDLVYDVSDRQIAKFSSGRTLEALQPGAALVTVRDSSTGVSTNAPVIVRQVIAEIDLPAAQIVFDALGDTLPLHALARDRLGSIVPDASLEYAVADTGVALVAAGSQLRSVAPGQTLVVVTDPETGIVGTAVVKVEQRATAIRLVPGSVAIDALGDTVPLSISAWDRLGASIANPSATVRSTDAAMVAVTAGGVVSAANGSALVIAESVDGPADTVQMTVAQRVDAIALGRDTLRFGSLMEVQVAQAVAVDRHGAPVRNATLTYDVEDTTIATVDGAGQVRAVANGDTRLLVVAETDTGVIDLRIVQRPVRVVASSDTVRFQAFGDVLTVTAVALDSLGSPVPGGVTSVAVGDSAVVAVRDSVTLMARGNGVSTASLTVAGLSGQIVVVVDQVASSLHVVVALETPIVTLPAGSPLPLACQATDRNGYAIERDPALIGSLKGTVTGSGCLDARVAHSGYDTLVFAMEGIQSRVPVVVSTGDSVAVLAAARPLTTIERERFVGEDLAHPSILALRPLVQGILTAYGNPSTNLDRARALRDWVARTAIHPYRRLHPDGSTSNLSVLPAGKSWADVNAIGTEKANEDAQYWGGVGLNGYAMLDRLLGTLDPTSGRRADDGMMVLVADARYQIRDISSYRYVLCSYQDIMLNTLWAAAGLHGMLISTVGHDPAAVFIPELGRWVYEDPEWNEEYLLDGTGEPLSPTDLLALTGQGQLSRVRAVKLAGPTFDAETYVATETFINQERPDGMPIMGSQLNNRLVGLVGAFSWPLRYVQIDVPRLAVESTFNDPTRYAPVDARDAFPTLGVVIEETHVDDSVQVVRLSSTLPNHQRFERRVSGGSWEDVPEVDVLPVGQCRVEYRSVDAAGGTSAIAELDVWTPRAADFLATAPRGGLRSSTRPCP